MRASELVNGLRHMADDHPCCEATILRAIDKLQQLERENTTLRDTMTRLHSECDIEARKAVAAERNNAALRNEIARLNNQTNWVCSCGGTDCAGQRENAELREQLEQAAIDEGKLRRENTRLLEAILNAPKTVCENAALRAAIAESEEFARKNGETCSAKIRDLLRENTRLQMELDGSCNAEELRQVRACVDRTSAANDRLVVENAALRAALAAAEDGLKHALMMEPGDPFARMKAITASLDAVRAVGKEVQP